MINNKDFLTFYKGVDNSGNDYKFLSKNIEYNKLICYSDSNIIGFNTYGYLKYDIIIRARIDTLLDENFELQLKTNGSKGNPPPGL